MKLRLALASATALGLMLGTASAGSNNEAVLSQTGTANSASVTQSGDGNKAGAAGRAMTQVDFRNQLTIVQSGNSNSAGTGVSTTAGAGDGIYQISNRPGVDANSISIQQLSDGNTVGAVSQVSTGTPATTQRNTVLIKQGDAANLSGSGGNTINSITQWRQSSRGNRADIEQSGAGNLIDRISQVSPTSGGGSNQNEMIVRMSGDENGVLALSGAAAASGATSSSLIQGDFTKRGSRNYISLTISGDDNRFGITQYGDLNTVGSVNITGSESQLGVYQDGNGNALVLSTIGGTGNHVGLRQQGDANTATVNITGDYNGGGVLAGVAGGLAGNTGSTFHPTLQSGLIVQLGNTNSASLTVTNSNDNQFAFLQEGNLNTISGSMAGTGSNSAAVAQMGNQNTANFAQNGSGNIAAIKQ
jgi:hypothetical protein